MRYRLYYDTGGNFIYMAILILIHKLSWQLLLVFLCSGYFQLRVKIKCYYIEICYRVWWKSISKDTDIKETINSYCHTICWMCMMIYDSIFYLSMHFSCDRNSWNLWVLACRGTRIHRLLNLLIFELINARIWTRKFFNVLDYQKNVFQFK